MSYVFNLILSYLFIICKCSCFPNVLYIPGYLDRSQSVSKDTGLWSTVPTNDKTPSNLDGTQSGSPCNFFPYVIEHITQSLSKVEQLWILGTGVAWHLSSNKASHLVSQTHLSFSIVHLQIYTSCTIYVMLLWLHLSAVSMWSLSLQPDKLYGNYLYILATLNLAIINSNIQIKTLYFH